MITVNWLSVVVLAFTAFCLGFAIGTNFGRTGRIKP